ncbi:MAG TPA: response regulator [Streptosporangiaceae bacterium]|jgi:DNA-binding NtrC family response regulator|nr:response regulator [Streptosporangiaceae bacterium]
MTAEPNVPGTDGPGRKARILIVEDEVWDAELAERLLTTAGLGFTSVVVATRASFISELAAFRPDVILSDYHLPGFSGEAALKIAQEQCPDIPFVFWSGVLGDDAAVELIRQGATDYVLKDRPARLPSVIHRALAEAEQRAHLAQLEDQLTEAQRLASLGQLAAAEEAMSLTRQLLAAARQEVAAAEPEPTRPPQADAQTGTSTSSGGEGRS